LLVVLGHWREDAEKKFSELFDKSKKIAKDFDIAMSCPRAARLCWPDIPAQLGQ